MNPRFRLLRHTGLVLIMGGGAACSASGTDYKAAAMKVIEGDISTQGVGKLKAACDDPAGKPKVGDVFTCTGTNEDGQVIDFTATIEDGGKVNVLSVNVLSDEDITNIEKVAVDALESSIGETLGVENLDCGVGPQIIETEGIICALTDPGNGDVYDSTVTISDLSDLSTLKIVVADAPR